MTRKEVRIEIKVRNNLILTKMEERGIFTVAELVEQIPSIARGHVYKLIAMKLSGRNLDGTWRSAALALSEFFQCMPEDLFSDEQQVVALETNRTTAEVGFAQIQQIMAPQFRPDQLAEAAELKRTIHAQLLKLSAREQRVIALRFGFNGQKERTYDEIGEMFDVCRERIRQIETTALRKLSHPSRSRPMRQAAGAVEKRRGDYPHRPSGDTSDDLDGEVLTALSHL